MELENTRTLRWLSFPSSYSGSMRCLARSGSTVLLDPGLCLGGHRNGNSWYGSVKNHKKTVKNGQARTRESEEFKKKPKIQSRSQKSQASVKSSQREWTAIERLHKGIVERTKSEDQSIFGKLGNLLLERKSMSIITPDFITDNELTRNNLQVSPMQVNFNFLQTTSTRMVKICDSCQAESRKNTVSYHKLFDVLKQFSKRINVYPFCEISQKCKSISTSCGLCYAQPYSDNYYQAPVPQRMNGNHHFNKSSSTRNSKNLALLAKYFKHAVQPTTTTKNLLQTYTPRTRTEIPNFPKDNNDNQSKAFGNQRTGLETLMPGNQEAKAVKDYAYHKEKMKKCNKLNKIDEQELEAHYSYMAKIQEVSPAESSSTDTPLEQVQNHDENDVFDNVRRHSEQPESINDTYVLEQE
ncbi:hypothetical protein Tco_0467699 [Tanacetum coccineum]